MLSKKREKPMLNRVSKVLLLFRKEFLKANGMYFHTT